MHAFLLSIAAAIGAGSPAGMQSFTAPQMFALADEAGSRGNIALAETIYRAMFADPSADIRLEARFRLAMIERRRGNYQRAATLLRQIVDARPSASRARLELAGLLDRLGDKDGAWRQLRAAQAIGLPPAVARLVDRYSEALRGQRPFGASIEVALAPDSNINRATRADRLGTIFGDFQISDSGRARSGTGISLNGQMYRRFALGTDQTLLVRLSGFGNLYRHKDFDDVAADLAVGPELSLGRQRLQLEVGLTERWYGMKPFMRTATLAGTLSHPMGGRTLLRLSGSFGLVDNQLNNLQDGRSYSGQVGLEHALSPTMGIAGTFALDRESLKDPAYATTGWRGGVTVWRDVGRATVTLSADVGRLHADDRLALLPERREDRYTRFAVGASFRQLQVRGFAPLVRFSVERNRSSVEFYDYRRMRSEFGVVRAF